MLIEKNEYEGYRSIEDKLKPLPFETAHTSVDKVVVGIIGAGAAGLYAALILESLGKKYISKSTPYLTRLISDRKRQNVQAAYPSI